MTAIRQWGDDWILGTENAPVVVEHTACGAITRGRFTCDHCGEELTTKNLRAHPGPGAGDESLLPTR